MDKYKKREMQIISDIAYLIHRVYNTNHLNRVIDEAKRRRIVLDNKGNVDSGTDLLYIFGAKL